MFTDGSQASGMTVEKTYDQPGMYSEILQIVDEAGRRSYDFAVVLVTDRDHPEWCVPTIHAVYYPTMGIAPRDEILFKVRTFGTTAGNEVWDFGDGSSAVTVQSDGDVNPHDPKGYAATRHAFTRPGNYLVRVQRRDEHGFAATARLWVHVGGSRENEAAAP